MTDVHVTRHGARWAVATDPGATPISEHATLEEAKSAARALAGDSGRVHVSEEDASGLQEDRGGGERPDPAPRSGAPGLEPERLRGEQSSF